MEALEPGAIAELILERVRANMQELAEAKSSEELIKLATTQDERDRLAGRFTGDELLAALKTSGERHMDREKAKYEADQFELHALRKEVMLLRQQEQSRNTDTKTSRTTVRVVRKQ